MILSVTMLLRLKKLVQISEQLSQISDSHMIIRIFNGCVTGIYRKFHHVSQVWIENAITRVTVRHQEGSKCY